MSRVSQINPSDLPDLLSLLGLLNFADPSAHDEIAANSALLDFLTAYIGIPIFFTLFFGWKFIKKSKWKTPEQADLFTGKAEMDAEDGHWPEQIPRNIWEKVWFWIA